MRDCVLVIGAGPAGIASAYWLDRLKIPFRVVDQAAVIASTWANLYPSLQLNTLNMLSHLPGERMPLRFGWYPMGTDFYRYIKRYIEKRHFPIALNVRVTRVSPVSGGWCVESSEGVDEYRAVIVATGRFTKPFIPPLPGMETFTGTILHARDFHQPEAYRGQRVVVVGSGPSGGDIAAALAGIAASPVIFAVRSDIVLGRRYPLGLPHTFWQIAARRLPQRWRKPFQNATVYMSFPGVEKLPIRFAPNREDRQGTSAPVRGRELYDALKTGTVIGTAGVQGFDGGDVVLLDGTRYSADVVIMCTGYRPALDYLDISFETDKDGLPIRTVDPEFGIEGMQIAGYTGLYLVGRFYQGLGAFANFRSESRIAAEQIKRDV